MWLDDKYVQMFSSQLQGFVRKSDGVYNFRCPICGDSKQSKSKKRGYLLRKGDSYIFYCHNGCPSRSFTNLLKEYNRPLYDEYVLEKFKREPQAFIPPEIKKKKPKKKYDDIFNNLRPVKWSPIAYEYLEKRGIPSLIWNKREMYYTAEFQHWTNKLIAGKFDYPFPDKRIVLPLRNPDDTIFGFQGRAINLASKQRYITIKLDDDEEQHKLYGCEKCNFNKTYYVVEGPFDSMFLDNAIASCGGNIQDEVKKLGIGLENSVIIYDNQPRNKQVCDNIFDAIESNYRVVIWPKNIEQKDINDMINAVSGNNVANIEKAILYIKHIIEKNTYQGLEAHLKFVEWRK